MKIKIISAAVILRTSLPMYFRQAGLKTREAATLSWVLFPEKFPFPSAPRRIYNHTSFDSILQ